MLVRRNDARKRAQSRERGSALRAGVLARAQGQRSAVNAPPTLRPEARRPPFLSRRPASRRSATETRPATGDRRRTTIAQTARGTTASA
ncbi:hypothetical protein PsYK624_173280 [Phanerochaete sordida]|uniref:Uncharacterized protein n=1 Tax=Phanerochaete sordida TaxID=48140 RepID=A0A9P3LN14_9APHY|nr:hypothetical protein PsYK624_173280 [Phanerochaete sordida]